MSRNQIVAVVIVCWSTGVLLPVTLRGQVQMDWMPARLLPPTGARGLAFDSARQRLVLMTSHHSWPGSGEGRSETWEREGYAWLQRSAPTQPPGRLGFAVAYDSARKCTVLFGGDAAWGILLADTWEWDGVSWNQRQPRTMPPIRDGHAMAFDVARQRVVLFGGHQFYNVTLSDTWEWDGVDWVLRAPTSRPPARHGHAMAYDSRRERCVLFGGSAGPLEGTWEWDGTTWAELAPASSPPSRGWPALAYDPARQRTVLFLGIDSDTWEWDGTTWTQRKPAASPPAQAFPHAMAFDEARRAVVLFGSGTDATWEWDGTNWSERAPSSQPTAGAIAYDLARQRTVLFTPTQETWEWDGARWSRKTPASSPPTGIAAMAYDAAHRRVLLQVGSETWHWDGSNWSRLTSAQNPGGAGVMASDPIGQRVFLLAGAIWVWDGIDWTLATIPPGYGEQGMTYDVARQRVVVFGGWGDNQGNYASDDTWEWDGRAWTRRVPATRPWPRLSPTMAYDLTRQRVVLIGGFHPGCCGASDTWEWDGTIWTQQAVTSARYGGPVAYDQARERLVLVNGATSIYGPLVRATATQIGTGCAGTNDTPLLTSNEPHIGNPAFVLDLLSGRPSTPCAFALSARDQSLPIGRCTLYVKDPLLPLLALTNGSGFASVRLAVPNEVDLRGQVAFAQAFVLEPQFPAMGMAFSAGRRFVIGD